MAIITKKVTGKVAWNPIWSPSAYGYLPNERFSKRTITFYFLGIKVYQSEEEYDQYKKP